MTTPSSPDLSHPLPRTVGGRVKELARLSGPVILSRSGMLLMAVVDTIMVGRFSAQELAYQAIAVAVTIPLFVTTIGLLVGSLVMTAKNLGAGNLPGCGAVWRRSMSYSLFLGAICCGIALFGEGILALFGQSNDLAVGGGEVTRILALGLPFMMIGFASSYFLEGLKRPMVPMIMMGVANLVNIPLNWVWVYGHLGFEPMGAAGSAWATTTIRILYAAAIVYYVWNLKDRGALAIRTKPEGGWRDWADQRRIGYSAGGSQSVESIAFAAQSLIAGLIGAIALGAYTIAFQMLGFIFMTAIGIGAASAVLVGHAWGRKDPIEMVKAGWTGFGANTVVMILLGIPLFFFAPWIARGFATDPELVEAAIPLISFMAFVLVADGGQAVLSHVLRGRGDTWFPVLSHTFSYAVVLLPLAIYLALVIERGAIGILEAILISSIVSVTLLAGRFQWLSRRDRQQMAETE